VAPTCPGTLICTATTRGCIGRAGILPALVCSQLLASVVSAPAWAALGDTVASIAADSQKLKASPRIATRAAFSIHELETPAGTVVREFVAPSGIVFAVAWRGPFKPSMPMLLGQYITEYARAPRTPGSTRSRLMIEQPDLIVHAAGHMRSFTGIAYVPQLLPANIAEADLK
jgi:uncharacterized protein DUF2844